MRLYEESGYLDIPHIDEVATRNDIAFIVIIGKRQVGKTYGVLKYMLDEEKTFFFLRRVNTELDMLCHDYNSPFKKIPTAGEIVFKKESKYTAAINRITDLEGDDINAATQCVDRIATASTLSGIGNIRGFDGSIYTDMVLDEFIPEEHLYHVRSEGDAFLNAYTTIAGNRELEGKPPLKCWLLANSNDLNNAILDALKITTTVEHMIMRSEDCRILLDRGIMILLPDSTKITEKRKQGALFKAIGADSKFARMAYGGEFAYNDFSNVVSRPLKEYNPYIRYGSIVIHIHKSDKHLYITDDYRCSVKYQMADNDANQTAFKRRFSDLKVAYLNNRIYFQTMAVKNYFVSILDL